MKKIQVFCIPYAGGNSYYYNKFTKYVNDNILITPIDYSGHGSRMKLCLYDNIDDIVKDVSKEIIEKKKCDDFALLGYSLGASVCYALYFKLYEKYNLKAKCIFFMANTPPYINEEKNKISDLDDKKFLESLEKYGGISEALLEDKELLDIFMPILRADIKAEENRKIELKKIDADISIIYSNSDEKNIEKWKDCANKNCNFYKIKGNHFFIFKNYDAISKIINDEILL